MGLTNNSAGFSSLTASAKIKKENPSDIIVTLSGNPNVGKSTLFNHLTGMNQHTGNWSGKTVTTANGSYIYGGRKIIIVDIPGSYSLYSHSFEEEVARDFICFSGADVNVVVCDATCLERNLNLLLQILEVTPKTILCINLIDEAIKKGITVNTGELEKRLKIPVVATTARSGKGIDLLNDAIIRVADIPSLSTPTLPKYSQETEQLIENVTDSEIKSTAELLNINPRFLALKYLQADRSFFISLKNFCGVDFTRNFSKIDIENDKLNQEIVSKLLLFSEKLCGFAVTETKSKKRLRDLKIDKIVTSKKYGFPLMLLLLFFIFWLTISASNYPSQLLSNLFSTLEDKLYNLAIEINTPTIIREILIKGVWRVVGWIVSVMLPPMAIFFPLFTLLEDLGYLPRLAFNLDKCFKKCKTCGKQALTMCMGFGCNAAGVVGCRIVDSPREKLIAILTNSFVPCNGRFPTLITMITIFLIGSSGGFFSELSASLILCGFILLSVGMTLFVSFILSKTVLKGVPSSFTLELPPYRCPQIAKVIVRSVFDRILFVLGRAIVAAIPSGIIIWLAANIKVDGASLLNIAADFIDPFAKLFGLNGVILIAFILGFPANEIVIPIIIMAYTCSNTLVDISNLSTIKELFVSCGWSTLTAINLMLFSLFHWPCATTVMTIKKETGSISWTALALFLPTIIGFILCFITNAIYTAVF